MYYPWFPKLLQLNNTIVTVHFCTEQQFDQELQSQLKLSYYYSNIV